VTVRVVAFARIRDIVGSAELDVRALDGATAGDVWRDLEIAYPALCGLGSSTRLVRNGTFVAGDATLGDGDELGLLPPYGGG
jgi:molybdopterin converting factor small subunit